MDCIRKNNWIIPNLTYSIILTSQRFWMNIFLFHLLRIMRTEFKFQVSCENTRLWVKFVGESLESQNREIDDYRFSASNLLSFVSQKVSPTVRRMRVSRRPVVEGQAQSGRAVAISGSKFNERTLRPVPRRS